METYEQLKETILKEAMGRFGEWYVNHSLYEFVYKDKREHTDDLVSQFVQIHHIKIRTKELVTPNLDERGVSIAHLSTEDIARKLREVVVTDVCKTIQNEILEALKKRGEK